MTLDFPETFKATYRDRGVKPRNPPSVASTVATTTINPTVTIVPLVVPTDYSPPTPLFKHQCNHDIIEYVHTLVRDIQTPLGGVRTLRAPQGRGPMLGVIDAKLGHAPPVSQSQESSTVKLHL